MNWGPWHWHQWGPWATVRQGQLTAAPAPWVGTEGHPTPSVTGFWYVQERVCVDCQWRDRRMREIRPGV